MNLYVSVIRRRLGGTRATRPLNTNGMEIVLARGAAQKKLMASRERRGGRGAVFFSRWMDDCNQSEKVFCPDYSLQSVSQGNDMYIILHLDGAASRTLPVSTSPKTWRERCGERSATCHSKGKGLDFISLNGFSRQLSPWGPCPDLLQFRGWHHLMYISTKRRRFPLFFLLADILAVFEWIGTRNFTVRGQWKNWAFRGTKWKCDMENNYIHIWAAHVRQQTQLCQRFDFGTIDFYKKNVTFTLFEKTWAMAACAKLCYAPLP